MRLLPAIALLQGVAGFGTLCKTDPAKLLKGDISFNPAERQADVRVVFLGDQHTKSQSREVLRDVVEFGADFVIHSGDFDYEDDPQAWDDQLNEALGADFPYFASIGNHDLYSWDQACEVKADTDYYGYDIEDGLVTGVNSPGDCCDHCKARAADGCAFWSFSYELAHCYLKSSDEGEIPTSDRFSGGITTTVDGYADKGLARLVASGASHNCTGEYGINMACTYMGITFVLSGAGTRGEGHTDFITETFQNAESNWRVSSWHKNQWAYQVGTKGDETGWGVYDTSREHGAIVATAHEHSYCRTKTITHFENLEWSGEADHIDVDVGQSFAFVSGLGGIDIRSFGGGQNNEWWAAAEAADTDVQYGALFCIFNKGGVGSDADCEFKDINGKVWDEFTISSPEDLAEREVVHDKCRGDFLEFPVRTAKDDMSFQPQQGRHTCSNGQHVLTGSAPSSLSLRFDDVQITKEQASRMTGAFLQVYGASQGVATPTNITIVAEAAPSAPFNCDDASNAGRVLSSTRVEWTKHDEEFEFHEVWVSPDLSGLVREAFAHPDWKAGDAVSLFLSHAGGDASRVFYSFDHSPCMAPTLAIRLGRKC